MAGIIVVRSNFVLNQVDIGDDVVLSTVQGLGLENAAKSDVTQGMYDLIMSLRETE